MYVLVYAFLDKVITNESVHILLSRIRTIELLHKCFLDNIYGRSICFSWYNAIHLFKSIVIVSVSIYCRKIRGKKDPQEKGGNFTPIIIYSSTCLLTTILKELSCVIDELLLNEISLQ